MKSFALLLAVQALLNCDEHTFAVIIVDPTLV